jgi:hypothetical protein
MLPTVRSFMAAHGLPDVTIVADAGMVSDANKRAIEAAGLSFILRARIGEIPYVIDASRREHPGQDIPDGHIFTQPWPASPSDKRRDQVIYYQYRHDRARRTLRGIDEQVGREGAGQAEPVHQAGGGDQDRQPDPGGQGPRVGRPEGLRGRTCAPQLPH